MITTMIEKRSIASNVKSIYSSALFDEEGYYIGPESEYNDNGIDTRTGLPFYGVNECSYSKL